VIEIKINGKTSKVDDHATVAEIARLMGLPDDATGVAVAVNASVVPKGEWRTWRLAPGDVVEIIRAMQGG
jgi:sulfur carrier protein